MPITIRAARTTESELITAMVLRSKAHWGYDRAFMAAVREELAVTTEALSHPGRFVAARGDQVLGYCSIDAVDGHGEDGELGMLFVDPIAMGAGIGRSLVTHALAAARERGMRTLTLAADPGAEAFYLRMGAERIGTAPSGSIPGRSLPRLRFQVDSSPAAGRLT